MSAASRQVPKPIRFLFENSVFLISGALLALAWANLDATSYRRFIDYDVRTALTHPEDQGVQELPGQRAGQHAQSAGHAGPSAPVDGETDAHTRQDAERGQPAHHSAGHGLTLSFVINDILMALFFAIAAKEVWEALLPGGPLSDPRKAATPLLSTLGGIVGPAGLYLLGTITFSSWSELGSGWAIPCATDIAFSYLVARLIFGAGHPAIAFLLLLAIADDAAGLAILAICYPTGELQLSWLLLSVAAVGLGLVFRRLRIHSFWWYLLLPGSMSWLAFCWAGIHPALGLVPIIPTLPHARTDLGIFAREELGRQDTLNAFEHWWKYPVEIILGLFGLVNAGVAFSSVGTGTFLVLAGLMVGKPLGITLFTWLGQKFFKLEIPAGMEFRHVITVGMVAGIGFTVALFVSTAAFPLATYPQATLDAAKMGALGSFLAAGLAFATARFLGIRPTHDSLAAASLVPPAAAAGELVAADDGNPCDSEESMEEADIYQVIG